jgi:putative phosphoesterase
VVGVVSDTHGHVYPRIAQLLEGVDQIVHAGDVGSAKALALLRSIAPVIAVRGNCDHEAWASALPAQARLELGGVRIVVAHIRPRMDGDDLEDPAVGETPVVLVSGHTHIAALEQRGTVLYLNPGSAGPRRFGRPRTIARLEISTPVVGRTEDTPSVNVAPRVTVQIISAEE